MFVEHSAAHILLTLASELSSIFLAGSGYHASIRAICVGSVLVAGAKYAYFANLLDAEITRTHLTGLRRWTLQVGHDTGTELPVVSSSLQLLLARLGSPRNAKTSQQGARLFQEVVWAAANMVTVQRMSIAEHRVMTGALLQPEQASCRIATIAQRIRILNDRRRSKALLQIHVADTVAPVIITDPYWLVEMTTRLISNGFARTKQNVTVELFVPTPG